MCRIESQKAMKCVPFAINVDLYAYMKCSSSHAQNTFQPHCQLLIKLRIMTINIMLKVLIKFRASEMMCVELRAKSYKMCTVCHKCICICEMLFLACTDHTLTKSPVSETQDYDY